MAGIAELVELTKVCRTCGKTKNHVEFYVGQRYLDCKMCCRIKGTKYNAARREREGDEEYLRKQRESVTRARNAEGGRERGNASAAARHMALEQLRVLHQGDFDRIHARIRYDKGLD